MKALLSTALLALTVSTTVQAENHVLYNSGEISVLKITDDFTEELSSCQMTISSDKVTMSVFASKTTYKGVLNKLYGTAGNLGASGIKYKIDSNKVFQTGASYPSGDAIFPLAPSNLLDDLAKGKQMVIQMVPGNQFGDTARTKLKLTGSNEAITAYRGCTTELAQTTN